MKLCILNWLKEQLIVPESKNGYTYEITVSNKGVEPIYGSTHLRIRRRVKSTGTIVWRIIIGLHTESGILYIDDTTINEVREYQIADPELAVKVQNYLNLKFRWQA